MFSSDQYELVDFGQGRRLERFGPHLIDRLCPGTEELLVQRPSAWAQAEARFEANSGGRGSWTFVAEPLADWMVTSGPVTLQLKLTPFGHLGVFPEQAENWNWISERVRRAAQPVTVLNLFGYTGGSTLAAAAAGAEVVHVDAAKNTVAWARQNTQRSGLAAAKIRWITEDAALFARRELRRGRQYHAVILDPPSYGHGPRGETWKIHDHLPALLNVCADLTSTRREFMLLSCHTPGLGPRELKELLAQSLGRDTDRTTLRVQANLLEIASSDGRRLACGAMVRWPGED